MLQLIKEMRDQILKIKLETKRIPKDGNDVAESSSTLKGASCIDAESPCRAFFLNQSFDMPFFQLLQECEKRVPIII